MVYKIFLEWDEQSGIPLSKMYPLVDGIEDFFRTKNYGKSISQINVVLTCMPRDFRQRKKFTKDLGKFNYDILADYFLIKNVDIQQKKEIIRKQMLEITKQTFSKYKFDDFDKNKFLSDYEAGINKLVW